MNFVLKGRAHLVVGTFEVVVLIRKKGMEIVVKEEIACTEERQRCIRSNRWKNSLLPHNRAFIPVGEWIIDKSRLWKGWSVVLGYILARDRCESFVNEMVIRNVTNISSNPPFFIRYTCTNIKVPMWIRLIVGSIRTEIDDLSSFDNYQRYASMVILRNTKD